MADKDRLDSVRLDETAARRLLDRATELDAKLGSESTVADLRDAAHAAGISEEAFGRALAEMQDRPAPLPRVVPQRAWLRTLMVWTLGLLVLMFGSCVALRVIPNRVAQESAARVEAVEVAPTPTAVPAAPARRP